MASAGKEVEHISAVIEVADLAPVRAGQSTDDRCEYGGEGPALGLWQGAQLRHDRPERVRAAALIQESLCGTDDVQRVGLALLAGLTPRGDAVPTQDDPDGLRVGILDGGDIQS